MIEKINTYLPELKKNKNRETVIGFCRLIMEWMGIQPLERQQVLLDITETLKKMLVENTIVANQYHLYRLNDTAQNIACRLAVVKKINKSTLFRLSYHEMVARSWQHTISVAYDRLPYTIDFVTLNNFSSVTVVITQGDKIRTINFNKEKLSNLQLYKILPKWEGMAAKPKAAINEEIWSSLDLKEVNKEFYSQIKLQFDALIGIAKTQNKKANEDTLKQFAVRLIGRYIFCWFLKEKGIIPDKLLISETIQQHKKKYFRTFLTKLFFETLNAEITDKVRNSTLTELDELYKNIPYLNGGLFEQHPEDDLFKKLDLNDWLIAFVQVLENFDFTVDESSSQYQQVAIDPEMLGRIFENLLASQNPDTEKMANQRKAFGAFYTPREIVDYMVNESLKAHIETHILPEMPAESNVASEPEVDYKGTLFQHLEPQQVRMSFDKNQTAIIEQKRKQLRVKIDKLFASDCTENPFDKEETILVRKAFSDITVLDPACGSGAFPMGVMLRLMELRQIVGHGYRNNYDLKNEILSRSIFGVDIMPMAVEIARLRAWLSLVLEADYKPADRKNNFGIAALPNLDFKFICANSLIDVPENKFVELMAANHLKQFEELTKEYFSAFDYKKEQLKKEINKCINAITDYHEIAINQWEKEITKNVKSTENKLSQMRTKQDEYERQRKIWQSYKNIFDNKTVEFFNPKYFFPVVKNGFNVVIGNPPYGILNKKQNKSESIVVSNDTLEYFKNSEYYRPASGGMLNVFRLFILRSVRLLNDNGIFSEIFPLAFTGDVSIKNLRKYILENTQIIFIEAFPERDNINKRIFEAVKMSVCIMNLKKTIKDTSFFIRINTDRFIDETAEKNYLNQKIIRTLDFNNSTFPLTSRAETELLLKIFKKCKRFEEIGKCNTGEIDMTFCKDAFSDNLKDAVLLKGAIIDRISS